MKSWVCKRHNYKSMYTECVGIQLRVWYAVIPRSCLTFNTVIVNCVHSFDECWLFFFSNEGY